MELDRAFRLAMILAWDDLQNPPKPCSIRLEYEKEPGAPLDDLSVWADRSKGYQFLICNLSKVAASAHPSGAHFANGYDSAQLSQSLDYIITNQRRFTRAADAGSSGLVLVYPPTAGDRAEAGASMSAVGASAATLHVNAAPEPCVPSLASH